MAPSRKSIGFGALAVVAASSAFLTGGRIVAASSASPVSQASQSQARTFDVEPRMLHLKPGMTFRFDLSGAVGAVHARLFGNANGATLRDDGTFTAPAREGKFSAVFTDSHVLDEVAVTFVVQAQLDPLHARAAVLALPVGGRAPLEWFGGSGALDLSVTPAAAARIDRDEAGQRWVVLQPASPSAFDVDAIDRLTHEHAIAHVVVGKTLAFAGAASVHALAPTLSGAVAFGDLNGDGRTDLVVGDPGRARAGIEAGGVFVFYGHDGVGFGKTPDATLEGALPGDHYGAVLLVRDMNGDRIDDLVVAAPDADLGDPNRGAVYIFPGTSAGIAPVPDLTLAGEGTRYAFGSALAARDLDGDGSLDLLVGEPFSSSECHSGRVLVFRGDPAGRGLVEPLPWQSIDLSDPLANDPVAPLLCMKKALAGGAAIAVLDMDGDGFLDLAAGEPLAVTTAQGYGEGAVDIYRGGAGGVFASTPSWAIHPEGTARHQSAGFGGALDVVPTGHKEQLVVRELSARPDGFWSFAPGSLGAPVGPDGKVARVRVVTTRGARSAYAGPVGTGSLVADVDGDGQSDYVVSDALDDATRLVVFHADDLVNPNPALTPFATVPTPPGHDRTGARIAAWRDGREPSAGIALLAPTRTTSVGSAVGAVDVIAPAPKTPLSARVSARTAIALPNIEADDRVGSSSALLPGDRGALEAFVGAPGASAPSQTSPAFLAGNGRFDRYAVGDAKATALGAIPGERDESSVGGAPPVLVDFDGDGVSELAVVDAKASTALDPGVVDPDGCLAQKGVVLGGGVVRILSRADGKLVERARLVGAWPAAKAYPGPLAAPLAAADVNGDGKQDIALAHYAFAAIEVILGRPFVPGKVVLACRASSGPKESFAHPVVDETAWANFHFGFQIVPLGDIDRDGCDELAFTIVREQTPTAVGIAFGYDASRAHCQGHASRFVLLLAGDGRYFGGAENPNPWHWHVLGDPLPRRMATALAGGGNDLTGDRVPDLVVTDRELVDETGDGPAVEIVSGAYLASICPGHVCAKNTPGMVQSGDWLVASLEAAPRSERVVLRSSPRERQFGESVAVGDLDGDHVPDLVVGVPESDDAAPFAGAARVYRGPVARLGGRTPDPWVLAVGDPREKSGFGGSVSIAHDGEGGWLLAGAPHSTRAGTGTDLGAAYLFHVAGAGKGAP